MGAPECLLSLLQQTTFRVLSHHRVASAPTITVKSGPGARRDDGSHFERALENHVRRRIDPHADFEMGLIAADVVAVTVPI